MVRSASFSLIENASRPGTNSAFERLAATIGSKASFKKLNKRSIISANISKLCDMIAEPEEPLALRLSSNLLVGVARCVSDICSHS